MPKKPTRLGIIVECKQAKERGHIEKIALSAIAQIQTPHYTKELKRRGIQKTLDLAFRSKTVCIQETPLQFS